MAVVGGFELIARPEDGALGRLVEAIGIEHGALVVVAEQDHFAGHDPIDAFARIGTVTDDVAEAVDLGDVELRDVCEDGLESFQVTVNVADDGLHAWPPGPPARSGTRGDGGFRPPSPRLGKRLKTSSDRLL